jgi:23S rRNA (guanosine2251-2'-O)-methyltransferase
MPEKQNRRYDRDGRNDRFSRKPRQNHEFSRDPRTEERADDDALNLIEGRNAVHEALVSGRSIEKLFVQGGTDDARLAGLIAECRESGAQIVRCDKRKLDAMSQTRAHQGAIAMVSDITYATVADIFARAAESGRPPLIVICDHLNDPQNLGAIVRSAEVFGAHGVIIPKRRSVSVTATAVKASAGACLHMPIVRCTNLHATIEELKKAGVWIYGADGAGDRLLAETDLTSAAAIVMGSEGDGMSRLTRDDCDFLVRIPMLGKVNSLNVSAAAAVFLYEAVRQRS